MQINFGKKGLGYILGDFLVILSPWGWCYDSNFLQFSAKNGIFPKNQCYDKFFAKNQQ
jgi:hypothetical protein